MSEAVATLGDTQLDEIEIAMLETFPAVELPLVHRFTPGLYIREIFMPTGTLCTSKIHRTEHPYVVTRGKVSVFIDRVGVEHIEGPHVGITKAGTRRLLYIHEDCTWLTFHPISEAESGDLVAIEARIIEPRELLDGRTAFEFYEEVLRIMKNDAMVVPQLDYGGAP